MGELKHHSHEHKLILDAPKPILYKKAVCAVCEQPVHEMLDMLYRCATTPTTSGSSCADFFLHKTCAELPSTFTHPAYPQRLLTHSGILLAKYRFFAHVKCASSVETSSASEINLADPEESHLMHFPAPDEESLNKMMQQCVTTMATSGALQHNNAIVEEPSPYINHWAHEHRLVLKSRNTNTSTHDLSLELAHNELLICDGCTKPICLIDDIIYECNSCNYVLHRSCAQFPRKIQHHLAGNLDGLRFYNQWFQCRGCAIFSNGMCMHNGRERFDIGCASLPRIIKHEAHRHHLIQLKYQNDYVCRACWGELVEEDEREVIMFGCEKCEFYVHIRCMLKPHKVKHRWDPHPLYLILFPKDVADHPHEYECEFCSEQIDTNNWYYHCSVCDLSFHIYCIDPYWQGSNIKFGATNIYCKSHPCSHGLTYVQDKKKRRCKICDEDTWGQPVLECSPCKFVAHDWCARD